MGVYLRQWAGKKTDKGNKVLMRDFLRARYRRFERMRWLLTAATGAAF